MIDHTNKGPQAVVNRRRVYYISGFDPRGASFYYKLYKAEAALQEAADDCRYHVSECTRQTGHAVSWMVSCERGGNITNTSYTFLCWDDLVRAYWPGAAWKVLASIPVFYWRYTAGGGLSRTFRWSKSFFWSLLWPLIFLLIALSAAAVTGLLCAAAAKYFGLSWAMARLPGALSPAVVLWLFWLLAKKVRLTWLMWGYAFMLNWGETDNPLLSKRWDEFAQHIHKDIENSTEDEVLIVGHSAGASAAICVLNSLLSLQGAPASGAGKLKLLTLGNLTPMLASIKKAGWFRQQLQTLAYTKIPWLDFTAPPDPICYALVDPLQVCQLEGLPRSNYRIRSARFHKMFEPGEYTTVKRDPFRIHFQYIMASRQPVNNNYFKMTAGSNPLEALICND